MELSSTSTLVRSAFSMYTLCHQLWDSSEVLQAFLVMVALALRVAFSFIFIVADLQIFFATGLAVVGAMTMVRNASTGALGSLWDRTTYLTEKHMRDAARGAMRRFPISVVSEASKKYEGAPEMPFFACLWNHALLADLRKNHLIDTATEEKLRIVLPKKAAERIDKLTKEHVLIDSATKELMSKEADRSSQLSKPEIPDLTKLLPEVCDDARRRIHTFLSFCSREKELPIPALPSHCPSLSTLVPVYNETIIRSWHEMFEEHSGNLCNFEYMVETHLAEFRCFLSSLEQEDPRAQGVCEPLQRTAVYYTNNLTGEGTMPKTLLEMLKDDDGAIRTGAYDELDQLLRYSDYLHLECVANDPVTLVSPLTTASVAIAERFRDYVKEVVGPVPELLLDRWAMDKDLEKRREALQQEARRGSERQNAQSGIETQKVRNEVALKLRLRLWFSMREQTVWRTVCGMMKVEQACELMQGLGDHVSLQSASTSSSSSDSVGGAGQSRCDSRSTTCDSAPAAAANETDELRHFTMLLALQNYNGWCTEVKGLVRRMKAKPGLASDADVTKLMATFDQLLSVGHLHKEYPTLRMSYLDKDEHGTYSVQCRCQPASELPRGGHVQRLITPEGFSVDQLELRRIRLPGNPIVEGLAEGKPINQAHTLLHCTSEVVMMLDMNQGADMEQLLFLPMLLAEFHTNGRGGPDPKKKVRIVGFKEHIFSVNDGLVAKSGALNEFTFGTIIQRELHTTLGARLHYGHPDCFDFSFVLTQVRMPRESDWPCSRPIDRGDSYGYGHARHAVLQGGTSKMSKTINVSEDIFGGLNVFARGGDVSYVDYMQVDKGRDCQCVATLLFEGMHMRTCTRAHAHTRTRAHAHTRKHMPGTSLPSRLRVRLLAVRQCTLSRATSSASCTPHSPSSTSSRSSPVPWPRTPPHACAQHACTYHTRPRPQASHRKRNLLP